ncbi:MAG: hypothetical protein V1712_02825 [Patescibacteria group bacterium]
MDTISIGTGATGADAIAIGQAAADVSITDANWSITGAGLVTTASDVAVNGGDITTTAATFNLFNATATTVNIAGAATTISLGAGTGTTLVNHALTSTGLLTASSGISVSANQNITFVAGTGSLVMNSTVSNASDKAIQIIPSFAGGADLLTYSAISVDSFITASASTGTDTVNGLNIGDLTETGVGAITSTAIKIGTGWDYAATFAAGNVGIGTTTPGAALEINGNLLFSKEAARTISVASSTTAATAGGALTISSGVGNGAASGALTITSATSVPESGNGTGVVTISSGDSLSDPGGPTGNLVLKTGDSGVDGTSGNITMDVGSSGGSYGTISIGSTYAPTIDFAGGSGSTGCTITNATGALACAGNITGPSAGTVGYWTRASTTLSPATANDIVSITGNTGDILTVSSTSATNGNDGLVVSLSSNGVNTSQYAGSFTMTDTNTDASATSAKFPIYATYSKTGSAVHTGYEGVAVYALTQVSGGTLPLAYGFESKVQVPTGGIVTTGANFVAGRDYSDDGGAITNRYGLKVEDMDHGADGSSLVNQYGVYIEDMANATTLDYGIYVVGGDTAAAYFGDSVGIGDTTPAALFTVGTSDAFQVNSTGNITSTATGTALTLSGAATTAINISNSGTTTDINLQNGETIDNNTDGTITLTANTVTAYSTTASGTTAIRAYQNSTRGNGVLYLDRGSEGKDRGGVYYRTAGTTDWYSGTPYNCGAATTIFTVSTIDATGNCGPTFVPELTMTVGDDLVDADGSASSGTGTQTSIANGATLVSAASQNLCTDSLTTPTAVRVDLDADCTNNSGTDGTYIARTSATPATVAVTSAWVFNDADTDCNGDGTGSDVGCTASDSIYQTGQDLYIDKGTALSYQTPRLGINTASPVGTLNVVNNASAEVVATIEGGVSGTDIMQIKRTAGATTTVGFSGSGSDAQMYFTTTGNTFALGTDGNDFKISDNGSVGTNDRLIIDSNGNVGIGDTTPDALFDIDSSATTTDVSGILANSLTSGRGMLITSSATAITGAGRLLYVNHTGATGTSAILNEFASAATDETEIVKITATGALAAGKILNISGASMTTGTGIAQADLNALTTGIGHQIASSATAITGAGRLLYVNHTGATGTTAILNEFASAANDETEIVKITATAALAAGKVLDLSATALTTGNVLDITYTGTTGSGLKITDSTAADANSMSFFNNTAADVTAQTYLINGRYTDNADADADFLLFEDNNGDDKFTIGEEGATTIAGVGGSNVLTITAGDAVMSDGSLTITDADNAATLSVTNNTATSASVITFAGSGTFTGTTTSSFMTVSPSGLTSGTGIYAASGTLSSGKLVDLQVSGTAAAASQTALNILTAGANGTNAITTYGAQISNTHTNATSGTNIALYLNASGATTANYGLIVNAGNVGIGTAAPSQILSLGGGAARTIWLERSTVAGNNLTLQAGGAVSGGNNLAGGNLYLVSGTATGTGSSNMYFQTATAVTTGPIATVSAGVAGWDYVVGDILTLVGGNNDGRVRVDSIALGEGNGCLTVSLSAAGSGYSVGTYTTTNYSGSGTGYSCTVNVDSITGTTDNSPSTKMTILGSGNVGIGDTTPDALLEVESAVTTGGNFLVTNTGIVTSGNVASIVANSLTTGTALSITNTTGIMTTTGNLLTLTANAATTATGLLTISATGLTTGYAANINVNAATTLTTGGALKIVGPTSTATLTSGTGLVSIGAAGAFTTTAALGGVLQVSAGTLTGTVASITDAGIMTTTGNLLTLTANAATTATGLLTISATGLTTGAALKISAGTGFAMNIASTGSMLDFASTTAGNTMVIRVPTNSATQGTCVTAQAEGVIFQTTAGTQIGRLACVANGTTQLTMFAQVFTGTSTDLAEMYSTRPEENLVAGDVVVLDSAGSLLVTKSASAYDPLIVGVISDSPGFAMSGISETNGQGDTTNGKYVALEGRVPVKVNNENGPIAIGDYLTSSSTPGVAMKAIKAGPVLGLALEAYDGTNPSGQVMMFVSRDSYDPQAGQYLSSSGGEVAGIVKVTAAGTPVSINLTGPTNVNALRNIFETKLNGEMLFQILETGDASLTGKIQVGSLKTIAEAEIGGNLAVAGSLSVGSDLSVGGRISTVGDLAVGGNVATGGLVRLDNQGNLINIISVKVTASVNPDGTITLGNIPATSVGASVSVAQTSADPVSATRATLALSTLGQTTYDYLIWSESFQVSYEGRVKSKSIELVESLTIGSDDLAAGTLLSGKIADAFEGYLVKFETVSGRIAFAINSQGLLEADTLKTRALVIDNADEPRATIGSGIIPAGATQAIVSAPEVKPGMKIFLTPKLPITQSLAVTDIQDGNFTVSLASSVALDLPFDWWLVDVTNPSFAAAVSGTNYVGNSAPSAAVDSGSGSTSTPTTSIDPVVNNSGTGSTPTDTTTTTTSSADTTTTPTIADTTSENTTTTVSPTVDATPTDADTTSENTTTTVSPTVDATPTDPTSVDSATPAISTSTALPPLSPPSPSGEPVAESPTPDAGTVSASAATP